MGRVSRDQRRLFVSLTRCSLKEYEIQNLYRKTKKLLVENFYIASQKRRLSNVLILAKIIILFYVSMYMLKKFLFIILKIKNEFYVYRGGCSLLNIRESHTTIPVQKFFIYFLTIAAAFKCRICIIFFAIE